MKLLTHNLLTSRFLKNVQTGYPLKLEPSKIEEISTEYNGEFLQKMMKKIDYNVLRDAAKVCGQTLPENAPEIEPYNDSLIQDYKAVHRALFDTEIVVGTLTCPESGRKFPISDGIPNMLCNEDE